MRFVSAIAALFCALAAPVSAHAQAPIVDLPAERAVDELRHAVGLWDVTTEFINPDNPGQTVSVEGQYRFGWVVPDRVVQGMSTIPEWNQASAILFYVRPASDEIEMVSVGQDGRLWVMTGPANGDTRITPNETMPDGRTMMLRFTRYDVQPNSFRSRMEMSRDGGTTWRLGNRQHFRRVAPEE